MTLGFASRAASKSGGRHRDEGRDEADAEGAVGLRSGCVRLRRGRQSGSPLRWMPPKEPRAPAFETAAARRPPECMAMGADMRG